MDYEKFITDPRKTIDFLEFVVNSVNMTISLPLEKVQKILKKETVTARELAKMVGILSASIPAVIPAPMHCRSLQTLKNHMRLLSNNHPINAG